MIPEWFFRLRDTIFDGLAIEEAREWAKQILLLSKPGVDYEKIKAAFLITALKHCLYSMILVQSHYGEMNDSVKVALGLAKSACDQMISAWISKNDKAIAQAANAGRIGAWTSAAAWITAGPARRGAQVAWSVSSAVRSARWGGVRSAVRAAVHAAPDGGLAYKFFAEELIKLMETANGSNT